MPSTNVQLPPTPPVPAKAVALRAQVVPTSDSYSTGQRTVSVNATQGQISLRYAPINAKTPPQSTR